MEKQIIDIQNKSRNSETVTTEIKAICQQAQAMALMYAIEVGRRLKEAKDLLPHGEWGKWLKEGVNFSQSSANNFMRIFDEYGAEQMSFFGTQPNSQTLGNLPYTKALKLLAIPEEERETFVNEHHVEDVSTRELDRLIKERDEALKAAKNAEQLQQEAQRAQEEAEKSRQEAEKLEEETRELAARAEELAEKLEKAKEAEKKQKAKLKELKENPTIELSVMEKIKAEAQAVAADDAAKKIQAKIDEANERIEKAVLEKKQARQAAELAEAQIATLQKQLQMQNPDMMAFKTMFEQVQEIMAKLKSTAQKIKAADEATAQKLSLALNAFLKNNLED